MTDISSPLAKSSARQIVDKLIHDRAELLRRSPRLWSLMQKYFLPYAKYPETVAWVDQLLPASPSVVAARIMDFMGLRIRSSGIENLPRRGAVFVAANHPTGFVDAVAIYETFLQVRSDICIVANADFVRIAPGTRDIIIPVEWFVGRRTVAQRRKTLAMMRDAIKQEKIILIFPAGGIARGGWRGLSDLTWEPTVVKLSKKWKIPILPVHVAARNSYFYYFLELIHNEVRDLLRFHEIFHKRGKPFDVVFGPTISPDSLARDDEDAIAELQRYVENELPGSSDWDIVAKGSRDYRTA